MSDFYKDKNRPDGHVGCCKDCSKLKAETREAKKAETAIDPNPEHPKPTQTKACSACGERKTVDNFHKDANKADGYHTRCKDCRTPEKKEPEAKPVVTEKTCKLCNLTKKLDEFPKRGDGHRNECKDCLKVKYPPKKKEREPDLLYECSKCKENKKGSEFYDTASNTCKGCESKRMHDARMKLEGALRELLTGARGRSKIRGEVETFDLTYEYLKEIYERQNGLCCYSHIKMTFDGELKMSIERLDNKIGYVKGNIGLCCLEFNGQVQWTRDKIKEMFRILDQNITENPISFAKKTSKNRSNTPYDKSEYYESARAKMRGLVTSAKARAKKKTDKGRDMPFDLDFEFIVDLYEQQKGLCAYSVLPLRFGCSKTENWIISLERVDVKKGYTKNNVCLVCLEFNSTDHTMTKKHESETSTGWSKEKFAKFVETARLFYVNEAGPSGC